METKGLIKRIRILLILFILGLLASGITAFPLQWEIGILKHFIDNSPSITNLVPGLSDWINTVHQAITVTYQHYPFMAYGTDWLGFAHIVIAIAFIGPLRDPVKNIWGIEFGMIACLLILPLALIFGPLRDIPFGWQLIDCSFGVIGIIPLWLAHKNVRSIAKLQFNTL